MTEILILRGLQASGKSTYAKELITNSNWIRINKDDIRNMLFNSKWSREQEDLVGKIRDNAIRDAIIGGWDIVIDDTNIHPKHIINITKACERFSEINIEIKNFDTSVEECVLRDMRRENSVGRKVIENMYDVYISHIKVEDRWIK